MLSEINVKYVQDLQPLFEKYGDVGDIYLPLERDSGRSRGFAFVRYYDKRDAEVRTFVHYYFGLILERTVDTQDILKTASP